MLPTKSEDMRPRESEVGEAKQALLSLIEPWRLKEATTNISVKETLLPDSNRHPDL